MIETHDARPGTLPESPEAAFATTVRALRELGRVLGPAAAARYEAPPGFTVTPGRNGVPNPTLDLATDPRRLGLSDEVARTTSKLRRMAGELAAHATALSVALATWEGQKETDHA